MRVAAGDAEVALPSRQDSRMLWAYLLLHREAKLPRSQLAFALWPDLEEAQALGRLRRHLHRIRRHIERFGLAPADAWIRSERRFLRGQLPDGAGLDLERAERAFDRAQALRAAGETEAALPHLRQAAGNADRLLLEGMDADWLGPLRAAHRAQRMQALEQRAKALLTLERATEGALDASSLVAMEPLREASHRLLIRCRQAEGDRAAALAAYAALRELLRAELGVDPSAKSRRLHLALLQEGEERRPEMEQGGQGRQPRSDEKRSGIPLELDAAHRHARLVGRDPLLDELDDRLGLGRLLCLTGPGGVGKSALAMALMRRRMEEPLARLELETLTASRSLVEALAASIGLRLESGEQEELAAALTHRLARSTRILVLDACELRLPETRALIELLWDACPGLRFLATSRERLNLPWEWARAVPPLELPAAQDTQDGASWDQARLMDFSATRLALQRLRELSPELEIGRLESACIARICRRLDGLPLALELALPWLRTMSVMELEQQLERELPVAAPASPHSATRRGDLESMMAWSLDQLDEATRELLRRLACFPDGSSLEAAASVWTRDPEALLPALHRAVAASWLRVEATDRGPSRYRMLGMVRRFLEPDDRAIQLYVDWATQFAESESARAYGPEAPQAVDSMASEYANLLAALENARSCCELTRSGPDWLQRHAGLALALKPLWERRGSFTMAAETYLDLLAPTRPPLPEPMRCRLRVAAAQFLGSIGRREEAEQCFDEALAISHAREEATLIAEVLHGQACAALDRSDPQTAREGFTEVVAIERLGRRPVSLANAQANLGRALLELEQIDAAAIQFVESQALRRSLGDREGVAHSHYGLGRIAMARREFLEARAHLERGLGIVSEIGHAAAQCHILLQLAELELEAGQLAAALGAATRCADLADSLDDLEQIASARLAQSRIQRRLGLPSESAATAAQALASLTARGGESGIEALAVEWIEAAIELDDWDLALRLAAADDGALWQVLGIERRRSLRSALANRFEQAWADGRVYGLAEIVSAALGTASVAQDVSD